MSRENVEVVRRTLEAFRAGSIDAALEFIADDSVWYAFGIEDSEYRGHEGVRKVVGLWFDNIDDFAVEIHDLRDAGDKVVALTIHTGKPKALGAPLRQRVGTVYADFRAGQATKRTSSRVGRRPSKP